MTTTTASGFFDLLRGRRTIHRFRPDPVPDELLERALEAATWAPNHKLTEPWRFYLPGPQTAEGLVELNARLVAASVGPEIARQKEEAWRAVPRWVVLTCLRSPEPVRAREDYAACACAAHNLSLALWAEGVGMKWTTGPVTRTPEFHDLMWIDPEVEDLVGLMMLGYPEDVPQTGRRPLGEFRVALP